MTIFQRFKKSDFHALKFGDISEPDDEEKNIFQVTEKLCFKDWMEAHRVLPSSYSSEPGPWSHDRTPYLPELMDIVDKDNVTQFVFLASSQIAKSEFCHSYLMYLSHQKPGPAMVVLPDEKTSDHVAIERFKESYLASPALSEIYVSGTRNSLKTTNNVIDFAWASSVSQLGSKSKQHIFLDEVSKYRVPREETKPVINAKQRAKAFANKKILIASTPNLPGSEIDVELSACHEKYRYYVPCCNCGEYQLLRFWPTKVTDLKGKEVESGQVYWKGSLDADPVDIAQAVYICAYCKKPMSNREKNLSIHKGRWNTNDQQYGKYTSSVGAHIHRLYSRFDGGRLSEIVIEFISAKLDGSLKAMQGFYNNVLAENFQQIVQQPKEINLISKQTEIKRAIVPSEAICLTCGVDNQKTGKYYTVYAWSKRLRGWLIDYGILNSWEELDELIGKRKYEIEGDKQARMIIWKTAIDTGGTTVTEDGESMTFEVYNYVRRAKQGVHAIKGKEMDDTLIVQKRHIEKTARGDKVIPGVGLFLYRLNTQALLEQFYYQVGQPSNNESCITFHAGMSEAFLRHMMSYKKVRQPDGKFKWKSFKQRHDYVDASIYALALANPQFDGGVSVLPGRINVVRFEAQAQSRTVGQSVIKRKGMIVNPACR